MNCETVNIAVLHDEPAINISQHCVFCNLVENALLGDFSTNGDLLPAWPFPGGNILTEGISSRKHVRQVHRTVYVPR